MGSEHLVAAVLTVTITNTQGADELVTHITENTRNFIVMVLQTYTHIIRENKMRKQECIPVGCVPPAAVAVQGVSTRHPREQTPPGPGTPLQGMLGYHLQCMLG